MAKMFLLLKVLEAIRRMVEGDVFLEASRKKPGDFTRRRKLSFKGYIWYLLSNTKRSLTTGLRAFVNEFNEGKETLSKQAFSRGRQKILPEAFRELMDLTSSMFYAEADYQKWNGMRVTAVDGSRLNLPTSEELTAYFGVQKSSGEQVQALSSSLYDVLNGITIDASIAPHNASERDLAEKHLKYLKNHSLPNVQELVIFDRGYPSGELLQILESYGFKYLMRFNSTFISKSLITGNDCVITHKFNKVTKPMKLRIVILPLNNGEKEYLVTNLLERSITEEDFRMLYSKRWGIETHYSDVKNKLWMEDFSSKTVEGIQQDFYATLTVGNLAYIQIYDCRDEIDAQHNQKGNAYIYKANVNVTIGLLRDTVIRVVAADSNRLKNKLMKQLCRDVSRFVSPVRSGISHPRKSAHPGAKFSSNSRLP